MSKPLRLKRGGGHAHETTSKRFIEDEFVGAIDDDIGIVVMPEGNGHVCAAVRAQKLLLERRWFSTLRNSSAWRTPGQTNCGQREQ